MGVETVNEQSLRVVLTSFPTWMGDDIRTWIRAEEDKGQRFTSAGAAVRHAVDYITNHKG